MANKFNELFQVVEDLAYDGINTVKTPAPKSNRIPGIPETSPDIVTNDADAMNHFGVQTGKTKQAWHTPLNAVRSQVNSLHGQINNSTGSPSGALVAGMKPNPTSTAAALQPMPDCQILLQTSGQVAVAAQATFSNSATGTATFAIYRDGLQISQIYKMGVPATAVAQMVNLEVYDYPPNGFHAYAFYWGTSTGTITGVNQSRAIQAQNLRPQ